MAKVKQINQELKEMSVDQLRDRLDDYRRELFKLKLNSATSHVKDSSQFNKLKKNIARTLTVIQQKLRESN